MSEIAAEVEDRWAWSKGSPQEWATQYLNKQDARTPFRKAMDTALGSIHDGNGHGGMYFVERARFIHALEQMMDTRLTPPE